MEAASPSMGSTKGFVSTLRAEVNAAREDICEPFGKSLVACRGTHDSADVESIASRTSVTSTQTGSKYAEDVPNEVSEAATTTQCFQVRSIAGEVLLENLRISSFESLSVVFSKLRKLRQWPMSHSLTLLHGDEELSKHTRVLDCNFQSDVEELTVMVRSHPQVNKLIEAFTELNTYLADNCDMDPEDEDWSPPLKALKLLMKLGPKAAPAIPFFSEGIQSPVARVRELSAWSLRMLGGLGIEAWPQLVQLLRDDVEPVRREAVVSLTSCMTEAKHQEPAKALLQAFETAKHNDVRNLLLAHVISRVTTTPLWDGRGYIFPAVDHSSEEYKQLLESSEEHIQLLERLAECAKSADITVARAGARAWARLDRAAYTKHFQADLVEPAVWHDSQRRLAERLEHAKRTGKQLAESSWDSCRTKCTTEEERHGLDTIKARAVAEAGIQGDGNCLAVPVKKFFKAAELRESTHTLDQLAGKVECRSTSKVNARSKASAADKAHAKSKGRASSRTSRHHRSSLSKTKMARQSGDKADACLRKPSWHHPVVEGEAAWKCLPTDQVKNDVMVPMQELCVAKTSAVMQVRRNKLKHYFMTHHMNTHLHGCGSRDNGRCWIERAAHFFETQAKLGVDALQPWLFPKDFPSETNEDFQFYTPSGVSKKGTSGQTLDDMFGESNDEESCEQHSDSEPDDEWWQDYEFSRYNELPRCICGDEEE